MSNEEIKDRLEDINLENFIWLIYIIIIFLSFNANKLESDYFKTGNIKNKQDYRKLMILIFSILVIVYFTFFKDAYEDLKKLTEYDSQQKKNLTFLSFIASLLILISGLLYLYIIYKDENIDVEIAFN